MKRLLGVTLLASCAAIVVTGCGTTVYRSQPVTASKTASSAKTASPARTSPPAVSPQRRAAADAAAIRASFVPPPGARRLTAAPSVAGGTLKQPAQVPQTPALVDDASWWQAPGQPQAVLAWEQAHLPRSFTSAGSGSGSGPGVATAWSQEFSLPAVPAVLNSRELVIEVVSAGHGQTDIRVDSQVTWLPAKPAAERAPAAATSVTIRSLPGSLVAPQPPTPVTITSQASLRRIAALIDSLPVWPLGTYNCPADNGSGLELTFRGADGRTLAMVDADGTGCETVSMTVGGQSLPTLSGGAAVVQQALALTHR
jgi:hypothetical protein